MKIWLLALMLTLPVMAVGQPSGEKDKANSIYGWEADAPADPTGPDQGESRSAGAAAHSDDEEESWVDSSHSYATDQAQALSEWMDSFFSVPNYEIEQPQSLLRIDLSTSFDQEDGNNNNARLRGKLQLPALSKRLNLVFSDDSGDELSVDSRNSGDSDRSDGVGFLYEVSQSKRSRLDLTMGIGWNKLRPGARYRYQGTLGEFNSYRLTQRLQYENDDGFYATSQVELNRALSENAIVRWNNKGVYGEETKGVEWVTRLSLFERHKTYNRRHQFGVNYFAAINGFSDPDYVKNYRVGVVFRRQVFRDYLFLEVEPAYNYRKDNEDDKRQFAWSIALRFSIALERNLDKKRASKAGKDSENAGLTSTDRTDLSAADSGSQQQPAPRSLPDTGSL